MLTKIYECDFGHQVQKIPYRVQKYEKNNMITILTRDNYSYLSIDSLESVFNNIIFRLKTKIGLNKIHLILKIEITRNLLFYH